MKIFSYQLFSLLMICIFVLMVLGKNAAVSALVGGVTYYFPLFLSLLLLKKLNERALSVVSVFYAEAFKVLLCIFSLVMIFYLLDNFLNWKCFLLGFIVAICSLIFELKKE